MESCMAEPFFNKNLIKTKTPAFFQDIVSPLFPFENFNTTNLHVIISPRPIRIFTRIFLLEKLGKRDKLTGRNTTQKENELKLKRNYNRIRNCKTKNLAESRSVLFPQDEIRPDSALGFGVSSTKIKRRSLVRCSTAVGTSSDELE